jgi:capsid assembly protease
MSISLFLSCIINDIWAIEPIYADNAWRVLLSKHDNLAINFEASHQFGANESSAQTPTNNKISIIPLQGAISHRASQIDRGSSPRGASSELVGKWFDHAMNDQQVSTIVLDVNSPGGSVAGTMELSDKIYQARSHKRIIALANSSAASAAYWIASAASEFYVTSSGAVGSIGVLAMHQDVSQKLDKEGVKTSFIYAGKNKVLGNSFEPLSEAAYGEIQKRVNEAYDQFLSAVSRNRNVSKDVISQGYGEGAMVSANDAVRLGMVDGIKTMDQLLSELMSGKPNNSKPSNQLRQARLNRLKII